MEKYVLQRRDDQQKNPSRLDQLYKDTMSFRQNTALRVDIAADEQGADKPLWRGDHSFSSDAAKYSLLNFIEPEVAVEHPEWSTSQVRKTALVRFEQRLAQDLSYEQKESNHIESAVVWRIVETEPGHKELATEYGGESITLKKLWDHTREYAAYVGNSDAYNAEEEKAQRAMEQAFIDGDMQAYVSVISHPDAIRYVQIWERGDDGDIVSKQVDLYKTTGKDFSHSEGEDLIQHLAQFQQTHGIEVVQSDAHYAHFMVRQGTVDEQDIRTIATFAAAVVDMSDTRHDPSTPTAGVDVVAPGARESWSYVHVLERYVSAQIDEQVKKLHPQPDSERESIRKNQPKLKSDDQKQVVVDTHTQQPHLAATGGGEVIPPVPSQALPEHLTHEHEDPIKHMLAQWVITKTIMTYTARHHDGAGAAIFWLSHILKDTPMNRTITLKPLESTGKDIRLPRLADVVRVFTAWKGLRLGPVRRWRKERHKKIQEDVVRPTHIDVVHAPPKAKNLWKKVVDISHPRRILRYAEKAWRVLSGMTRAPRVHDASVHLRTQNGVRRIGGIQREIPKPFKSSRVERAFTALRIWLRLWKPDAPRSGNILAAAIKKHHQQYPVSDGVGKIDLVTFHTPDSAVQQPVWLLLCIIWYMTMRREAAGAASGAQSQAVSTHVAPASPPVTPSIPLTGVIYSIYHDFPGNMSAPGS